MRLSGQTIGLLMLALILSACKNTKQSKPDPQLYHDTPTVNPDQLPPAQLALAPPAPQSAPPAEKLPHGQRAEISSIAMEDLFLAQQAGKVMIFDARPAYFYRLGRIPGAIHLPSEGCDQKIRIMHADIKAAIDEGKTIVVYCSGLLCKDARTVARHLAKFGFPVSKFYGGWSAWSEANLPIDKDEN